MLFFERKRGPAKCSLNVKDAKTFFECERQPKTFFKCERRARYFEREIKIESKQLAKNLVRKALQAIENFDKRSDALRTIAKYVIERKR